MTDSPVTYRATDSVAWITLHRPAVLNALDTALAATLADHAETAAIDPEIAVVVVRGAGRAFCSGMDRTALAAGSIGEAFYRHWIRALNCLEDMPKVSLAVLHGHAIGGGLQLGLACDVRLAADDAVLGLGASRHGILPDGAVLRLARIVGLGRAKELALLNDHLTPAQGLAMGLVNWVAPEEAFEGELGRVIEKCLEAAPTAARHTKRLLLASFNADPRALIDDVVAAQMECMRSWELAEANRSWDEGRDARFFPPPARSRP